MSAYAFAQNLLPGSARARASLARACALLLLTVVGVLVALAGDARAEAAPGFVVDLYTIGPAAAFPSRFGHSMLCERSTSEDVPEKGVCFDYGVPDREGLTHMAWTSLRGQPSFVPITIPEATAIAFYKEENRQIERQRIVLSPEEASRLVGALRDDVQAKRAYAYHPYSANCTTKLRDQLDRATNGRLQAGPSTIPKGTLREYAEEGNTGHVELLTPMAIFLGEANDRIPTPWEAMFLPTVLRDGVADRFNAAPEMLNERMAITMPTSRSVGRIAIVFLAVVLFSLVRLASRRGRVTLALKLVGGVFGVLAVSIDLVSAFVVWPEVSHNWALLMFLPTDLALPYLGRRLPLYLKARLGIAAALAVLEIAGVAHQPLLPLAILVALPIAGLSAAIRGQDAAKSADREAPAPTATTT